MSDIAVDVPHYTVVVEQQPPADIQVDVEAVDVLVEVVQHPPIQVTSNSINVDVETSGPPGPKGETGATGPVGPVGPTGPPVGAKSYIHTQSVLAKVWNVQHDLYKHPGVDIEDAAGSLIHGSIQYIDDLNLTITFAVALTGRATLT